MKKIIIIFLLASTSLFAGTWDITDYLPIKLDMDIKTVKSKLSGHKILDITEVKGEEKFEVRSLKLDKSFWCVPETDSLYKSLIANNDSMLTIRTLLIVRKNKVKGILLTVRNKQDYDQEFGNGAFVWIFDYMTKMFESQFGELTALPDEDCYAVRKYRLDKSHFVEIQASNDLKYMTIVFISEPK